MASFIIGEENDLSYYQFVAYENERAMCEVARVEPKVRLDELSPLRKIILHQPNYLFNVTSIAVQMHYISNTIETYMNEMCFDVMKLGQFRDAPYECEPYLRSADIFSSKPYNEAFWKNYNVLLESEEEGKLIQDLSKRATLFKQ